MKDANICRGKKLAFVPFFYQNVIFHFLFESGNTENIIKPEVRGPNDRRAKFVFAPLVIKAIHFLIQHMDACCIPGPADPTKGGGGVIALYCYRAVKDNKYQYRPMSSKISI